MTFREADLVITTNESHKEIAVRRGGKSPDDVYVVRSGPSLDRFKIYEPDPAWRKGARFLFVYLGEICEQDGVDHMVRAIKHLAGTLGFRDFHAVFVGGGPHQPAIKQYAADQGVAGLLHLHRPRQRRGSVPHPVLGRHRHRSRSRRTTGRTRAR